MKAVFNSKKAGSNNFQFGEIEKPKVESDSEVLIKVEAIGICTSDIHALHETMDIPDGNIVGHEFSGIIEEMGSRVKGFDLGDRVVSELAIGKCGECDMCKSGHYEFCRNKQPQGWKSPGVYSEYTVSQYDILHKIPEDIGFNEAALTEPIAICVYGCLERGDIKPGDSVVIFGMGSIGLLSLIVLLDAGVHDIICVTPTRKNMKRFNLANEIAPDRTITPQDNLQNILKKLTGRADADCVVECSGSPQAIKQGLDILRKDGKFIALGISSDNEIPFHFNIGIHKALRIIFSSTSSRSSWETSLDILQRNNRHVKKIISYIMKLEEWSKAYNKLENREAVKIVLKP